MVEQHFQDRTFVQSCPGEHMSRPLPAAPTTQLRQDPAKQTFHAACPTPGQSLPAPLADPPEHPQPPQTIGLKQTGQPKPSQSRDTPTSLALPLPWKEKSYHHPSLLLTPSWVQGGGEDDAVPAMDS